MKKETIVIQGMSCVSCADTINKEIRQLKGVKQAFASYNTGKLEITYNDSKVSRATIEATIGACGYQCQDPKKVMIGRLLITVGIVAWLIYLELTVGIMMLVNAIPLAEGNESLGMLFVIGLLTSFHCIAMCGGLVLSQTIKRTDVTETENEKLSRSATWKPSFLYNLGRVISYTVIGGIVGALGAVFNMSLAMQGWIQIIGGVFMVIMGLNLLNIFPWLRKLNPRMPKFFAFKLRKSKRGKGSFYVGLVNGLMPCGPLQAMQLFALATGSPIHGALSMFVFSLGTVPLMFAVGAIGSILSKKFASKILAVGAVLVIVMGIAMLNRGLSLSGINLATGGSNTNIVAEIVDDVQIVQTTVSESWRYEEFTVQVGIPVVWTLYIPDGMLTGCNNMIIIPAWGIEANLSVGANVIEFTPTEVGTFQYMCWMAMIRSNIHVID